MLGVYKKHPQAYLLYVEDCFLLSDNADTRIFAKDMKKIILNSKAFQETDDKELQGFLRYVKTGIVTTEYTGRIEQMIQTVKRNEQLRKEYHVLPAAHFLEEELLLTLKEETVGKTFLLLTLL